MSLVCVVILCVFVDRLTFEVILPSLCDNLCPFLINLWLIVYVSLCCGYFGYFLVVYLFVMFCICGHFASLCGQYLMALVMI